MYFHPIVIGPHECKFDIIHILRFQETFVQTAIQERAIFVHVPVENETIDAIIRSCFNFLLHNFRVFFIGISPQRNFRLIVSRKSGLSSFHQFPFRPTSTFVLNISGIIGMVIRKIIGRNGDLGINRFFTGKKCRKEKENKQHKKFIFHCIRYFFAFI